MASLRLGAAAFGATNVLPCIVVLWTTMGIGAAIAMAAGYVGSIGTKASPRSGGA
jgi:hypothetical protein